MSRKLRFILHIGTEKTGTTTLQQALHANRGLLESYGVFYFSSPGRIEARTLAAAAIGDKQPDDYLNANDIQTQEQRQAFRESIESSFRSAIGSLPHNVHTVVLSSEHFHSRLRHRAQLEWLKALVSPFASTTDVVCYLRRQSELVASYYSTMLKNGETRSLATIAERICKSNNHYYNYLTLITRWSEVFGNEHLIPRIFDQNALAAGDVIQDFMAVTGLDIDVKVPGKRYNESLTPFGQALLRGVNAFAKEQANMPEIMERCSVLAAGLITEFAGRGESLKPDMAKAVDAEFDKSNEGVLRNWFPERDVLFAAETKPARQRKPPLPNLNSDQLKLVDGVVDLLGQDTKEPLIAINDCADTLRDMAIAAERDDPEAALRMMRLAHRIRPRGPTIVKKLDQYEAFRSRPLYRLKRWVMRQRG